MWGYCIHTLLPHCRSRRERLSHPVRQCAETLHRLAESGRQRGSRSEPLSVAPHDSVGLPHTHTLLPTDALGESDSHTQHDNAQGHSTARSDLFPLFISSLHSPHPTSIFLELLSPRALFLGTVSPPHPTFRSAPCGVTQSRSLREHFAACIIYEHLRREQMRR